MVPGRADFGAQNLGFTRCAKKSDTISSLIFPMYGDLLQDLGSLFTLWFGLLLARVGSVIAAALRRLVRRSSMVKMTARRDDVCS